MFIFSSFFPSMRLVLGVGRQEYMGFFIRIRMGMTAPTLIFSHPSTPLKLGAMWPSVWNRTSATRQVDSSPQPRLPGRNDDGRQEECFLPCPHPPPPFSAPPPPSISMPVCRLCGPGCRGRCLRCSSSWTSCCGACRPGHCQHFNPFRPTPSRESADLYDEVSPSFFLHGRT